MPNRFKSYSVGAPPPTGIPEVDDALSQWAQSMSDQQTGQLMEQERMPYTVSAQSTNALALSASPTSYLKTTVQLLGSESIIVHGHARLKTHDQAAATLRITYPGGTNLIHPGTMSLSIAPIVNTTYVPLHGSTGDYDMISNPVTSVLASLGHTWPIVSNTTVFPVVAYQTGGKMNFTLMTSGSGSIIEGSLVVDIR